MGKNNSKSIINYILAMAKYGVGAILLISFLFCDETMALEIGGIEYQCCTLTTTQPTFIPDYTPTCPSNNDMWDFHTCVTWDESTGNIESCGSYRLSENCSEEPYKVQLGFNVICFDTAQGIWSRVDQQELRSTVSAFNSAEIHGVYSHITAVDAGMTCADGCPDDPNKWEPGICGCGNPDTDTDTDRDGTPDCIDECPNNPNPDCLDEDRNMGAPCE
jgi:hypothetical protein